MSATKQAIAAFQIAYIKATGKTISKKIARELLKAPANAWLQLVFRRAKQFDDDLEKGSIWENLQGTYSEGK